MSDQRPDIIFMNIGSIATQAKAPIFSSFAKIAVGAGFSVYAFGRSARSARGIFIPRAYPVNAQRS